ncbi:MAG: EFR1 family ferrodoxin [Clostridiales bacterium]|nr:EFR1 family ferrodoxin [Clostridiales bacterium]
MNKIYYFTGTGNSLYIAQSIKKYTDDTELVSIVDIMSTEESTLVEGDRVGFVFPVYFARLPVVVQKFMESVNEIQANYIYSIIVGGGLFGSVLDEFNKKLMEINNRLDAGYVIKTPSNHPKISQLQRKSNDKLLVDAKERIKEISVTIENKKPNKLTTSPFIIGRLITRYTFKEPYMQSQLGVLDKVFSLDESCDACGKCIKYCPVNNITLKNGNVEWQHHCINCSRCYHICPRESILFGTDTMPRYMNPFIDINDLL